jgi:hypothetical protein
MSADQLQVFKDGQRTGLVDLRNLREFCAKQPAAACDAQKARSASISGEATAGGADAPALKDQLRLIVRPAGYRQAVEAQLAQMARDKSAQERGKISASMPLLRPLGAAFVIGWAKDTPNGMSPLSEAEIRKTGLAQAEMERISAANLLREAIAPMHPASARFPGVHATAGNDYLPSVLADEAFWTRVAGPLAAMEVSICLPARHELYVYVPQQDPARQVDFARLCGNLARDTAPTFFTRPIPRVGGKWQLT